MNYSLKIEDTQTKHKRYQQTTSKQLTNYIKVLAQCHCCMCKQLLLLYPARFLRMYEIVISGERLLTRDQNPENNNLNSRKAAAVWLLNTSVGEGDISHKNH